MKILIVKSENGKVTLEKIAEGEISKVLRDVAKEALEEWNELASDFIIMRDNQEVRLPLPLKPEVYEAIKTFLVGKDKKEALAKIPLYIISYENEWKESDFQDKKIYVVSFYINDEIKKGILDDAAQMTSEQKQELTEEEEKEDLEEE
ncbi:DUF2286 domain-containing protein [Sulfolobus sp. E5-1-F]|uniref:DUF2286 domain-containing protein n=1 Tax=Sulfolobaceae TaxID=118883 RepID=UPI00129675AD|nr:MULTISPECIES: DUF2286 domain-containing protein [unclassified Sulfolobus]QGA54691.1 DUF2286 domain-containing protein [Sulfolobus sp. E5-1-F]QGA67543.1 DUF2286 domain-containing protein [Sulfolobus sp. E11-6]